MNWSADGKASGNHGRAGANGEVAALWLDRLNSPRRGASAVLNPILNLPQGSRAMRGLCQ